MLQDASGNPVDSSGNGLDMTSVVGTPTYRAAGPMSDYALEFDSFTENVQRSSQVSTVTTNFSIEFWWYPIEVGAAGRTIFRNDTGAASGWGVSTESAAATTKFARVVSSTVGPASVNTPPLNAWSHIVVLRREVSVGDNHWEYYFNGNIDTDPVADTAPATPAGVVQLNAGNFLRARYAYVAVYEKALSANRISAHYQAGVGQPSDDPPMGFSGRGAGW